ncbi:MAG: diacylglycerol kinase family lipid kinase [Prolixibacteraceae bacterium]|jgi:diacylglycerol kinase (ATP)|nr:diacylglycerol kinase family lipid kinase [Prolixibacteraceae bacterium]
MHDALKHTNNIHVLFVVNPKSGKANSELLSEYIADYSKIYRYVWQVYYTTGKDDSSNIRQKIKHYKPEIVIAAGGDGTINNVARLLLKTEIKLGIIPMGSANGFAYNLRIPANIDQAIKIIFTSIANPVDVIKINDKYYSLHLSDIGINARTVKRFEQEKSKGLIGYGTQLFKELFSGKTHFKYNLSIGQFSKKSKAEIIVIANAKAFGTGAQINPEGNINDGKFEVVVIKPYPWWIGFMLLFSFFTGKLHQMRHVRVYKASKAKIKLSKPQVFQIDGEILDDVKYLNVEIIKRGIKVIF